MPSMLSLIHKYIQFATLVNQVIGKSIPWLCLLMVLITFTVVVLRYAFNFGNIALQESIIYMHASVFMLAAAYTLNREQHVRVDIFYHKFTKHRKAWVNIVGTLLFLLPLSGFILWSSSEYVITSWTLREGSREAGGLPYVYLLKSNILAFAILLIIQGLSDLFKNILIILNLDSPVDRSRQVVTH